MNKCETCARAKEDRSRDLFPIWCTKRECWVEYYYSCNEWVEAEDDGYITRIDDLKE